MIGAHRFWTVLAMEEVAFTAAHFSTFFYIFPTLFSFPHPTLSFRVIPERTRPKQSSFGGKENGGCAPSNSKSAATIVDAAACGGRGEDGGAAKPPDEAERVGFLCGLGIVDSPADPRFDDITKLAS